MKCVFVISWMTVMKFSSSTVVVTYTTRNFGGAWEFMQIAEKIQKEVFDLFHK